MAVDASSGVFVVGFDVRGDVESWWMKRFDAQGIEDVRWDHAFPGETKVDRCYGVVLAPDGSAYLLGEARAIVSPGTFGWVRKFDREGREVLEGWGRRFDNAGARRPTMAAVSGATDADGNLFVLLELYGTPSIRKLDAGGHELAGWPRDLPDKKDLSLAVSPDGSRLVAGGMGYPDQAWLAKLEADGSTAWEKTLALGELSAALAVGFDRTGNVVAAGYATEPTTRPLTGGSRRFSPTAPRSRHGP